MRTHIYLIGGENRTLQSILDDLEHRANIPEGQWPMAQIDGKLRWLDINEMPWFDIDAGSFRYLAEFLLENTGMDIVPIATNAELYEHMQQYPEFTISHLIEGAKNGTFKLMEDTRLPNEEAEGENP